MRIRGCFADRTRMLTRWSVGVVGMALLVSCSTAAPDAAPSVGRPTATLPPAAPAAEQTPPAGDAEEQAAVAAYVGMWQAMARAGESSDWRSPELADYATGAALTVIIQSLYADHANGVVTRGAPTHSPVVRSAEPPNAPTTVLIDDCGDSTNSLKYFAGTDTPAGDGSGGGRRAITAEVVLEPDGVWRVTRFAVQGVGSC